MVKWKNLSKISSSSPASSLPTIRADLVLELPVEIQKNPEKNGFFLDDIGIIPPLYPKEASFSNPVLLRFIVAVHFNPIEPPQVRFENLLDYPHRRHESEASRSHSDSVPRADISIHAILRSRWWRQASLTGHVRRSLWTLRRQPPCRLPHRLRSRNG